MAITTLYSTVTLASAGRSNAATDSVSPVLVVVVSLTSLAVSAVFVPVNTASSLGLVRVIAEKVTPEPLPSGPPSNSAGITSSKVTAYAVAVFPVLVTTVRYVTVSPLSLDVAPAMMVCVIDKFGSITSTSTFAEGAGELTSW